MERNAGRDQKSRLGPNDAGGGGDAPMYERKLQHHGMNAGENNLSNQGGQETAPVRPKETTVLLPPVPEKGHGKEHPQRKSKSNCSSWMHMVFGTRELVSKYDREDYIRTTLCELCVYVIYLIVICTITYGLSVSSSFYFTNSVSQMFLDTPFGSGNPTTFRTSTTVNDFWTFTETVMPNGLYWKYWYGMDDPAYLIREEDRGVLYENRLMGRPRLRQLRVINQTCPISEKFQRLFRTCYPPYSESYEDHDHYHPTLAPANPEWTYHSQKNLSGSSHWGLLATYSGAGAVKLLGSSRAETIQFMGQLKNLLWISRSTRVVFLDFTVHNANVNLFCIVTLVWEFPATGGVVTSWSIRTIKLDRYSTVHEYFLITLEIIFILFTIYYTIQEVIEMYYTKCSGYWSEFWTYLDFVLLIISYACIAFGFYRYFLTQHTLADLLKKPDKYNNFFWLGFWEMQFNNTVAVLLFLAWIKIFKYISFNKTMSQLSSTMSRCSKDVGGFAIMFFIVFFAFAQLGYLLFGSTVHDFRTFHDTAYALLRLILGDFDFRTIEAANRILGPVFFITYIFFVFFVLLNMFLAIINDTYSEVKAEIKTRGEGYELSDYIKGALNNAMALFGCKNKQIEAEIQAKLYASENMITHEELRENLTNSQYTDVEVEMFLTRYELDEDRPMDVDEAENVLGGLEGFHSVTGRQDGVGDNAAAGSDMAMFAPAMITAETKLGKNQKQLTDAEISELQSRVGILESTLTHVTRKMDSLLEKLERMSLPKTEVTKPSEIIHF